MPGNEPDPPPSDTESSAVDVFALVGNEVRAEILRVLRHEGELAFSELQSRMGTDVEPSQLHYHLKQLVGPLVTKTDTGYTLGAVGHRICQTLDARTFDRRAEQLAVYPGFDCYLCRTPVEAVFEAGRVRVECPACEYKYVDDLLDIPFETFDDAAAAFSHLRQYMVLKNLFLARGICPSCTDQLGQVLHSLEDDPRDRTVLVIQSCDLCGATWNSTVGMTLVVDEDLRTFCSHHGVDLLSTPYWELEFAATDNCSTVRSTDPWEVAVEVTFDGDTLELVVDGDLNIVERNRPDVSDDERPSGPSSGQRGDTKGSGERSDEIVLADSSACLEVLRRSRWPEGVACPHCDTADTVKVGTTSKGTQRYRCDGCDSIFNDLTGTIFAEHRMSLPELFHIIRAMDETQTAEIARQLDRPYNSVLDFVHKVEDARVKDAEFDLAGLCDAEEISVSAGEKGSD